MFSQDCKTNCKICKICKTWFQHFQHSMTIASRLRAKSCRCTKQHYGYSWTIHAPARWPYRHYRLYSTFYNFVQCTMICCIFTISYIMDMLREHLTKSAGGHAQRLQWIAFLARHGLTVNPNVTRKRSHSLSTEIVFTPWVTFLK